MKILFLCIIFEDRSTLLLCATYRPQWQGSDLLIHLTEHLDDIMVTHNCQNVRIVGDLNQHLVMRAIIEIIVVQGFHNHVDFPTQQRGRSLDPVLTDMSGDCVQCRPLDRVGSSDHQVVLSTISLAPARDEEHQRIFWLWDRADSTLSIAAQAMKLALTMIAWNTVLSGDPHHDVTTFITILHSLQQQHVPHRQYCTSPKDQLWFGYRCRVAAEQKYRAWMHHKRHPTRKNKALHRTACKTMTRTAKWAKARWLTPNNVGVW